MGFDYPWAFLFLFALVPVFLVLRRSELRTKDVLTALKNAPPAERYFGLRYALISLFICSLVIVGSGPYWKPHSTGDLVFLVDTSRSMQARHTCAEPTFLDRSKSLIRDVLSGVPEGRFGIVAFDRLAFPVTQLTYDHAYLNEALDNALFIGMTFQATRTDLGNALSVIARKKRSLPQIYGKVRYAILLSDGYLDDSGWRESLEQPSLCRVEVDLLGQFHGFQAIGACQGIVGETEINGAVDKMKVRMAKTGIGGFYQNLVFLRWRQIDLFDGYWLVEFP